MVYDDRCVKCKKTDSYHFFLGKHYCENCIQEFNLPYDMPNWDIGLNQIEKWQVDEFFKLDTQVNAENYKKGSLYNRNQSLELMDLEKFLLLTSALRIMEIINFRFDRQAYLDLSSRCRNPILLSQVSYLVILNRSWATHIDSADLHYYGVTTTHRCTSIIETYEKVTKAAFEFMRTKWPLDSWNNKYNYERHYQSAYLYEFFRSERFRLTYEFDDWIKSESFKKAHRYGKKIGPLIESVNKTYYRNKAYRRPENNNFILSGYRHNQWLSLQFEDFEKYVDNLREFSPCDCTQLRKSVDYEYSNQLVSFR